MKTEILDLMDKRRTVKQSDAEEYKRLDKEIKLRCNEAKDKWLNDNCEELESLEKKDSQLMHCRIKELTNKNKHANTKCIKAKDQSVITGKDKIMQRWKEYIFDLYEDKKRGTWPIIKRNGYAQDITESEVKTAMKEMKSGKAVGNDQIAYKMLETVGTVGISKVTEFANIIYNSGEVPKQMLQSIFIALSKKAGTIECDNYRLISLMSHIMKIILRIIMNRNKRRINEAISDVLIGYISGKGTRNTVLCLRMIMEKAIEKQNDLYICFIDSVKAFDRLKHQELIKVLEKIGIDEKNHINSKVIQESDGSNRS